MKEETVTEAASTLAGALEDVLVSRDPLNADHSMANVVDGLYYIGQGLRLRQGFGAAWYRRCQH